MKNLFCLFSTLFMLVFGSLWANAEGTLKLSEINIRDPYILVDSQEKVYYLYRTHSTTASDGVSRGGVEVFKSKDLINWEGPVQVFSCPEDNWITGQVWAPEVHHYRGKYYLFATLNSNIIWKKNNKGWPAYSFRGTQIFHSSSPDGPFVPFEEKMPVAPMDMMTLDGTLWVENDKPYMIFCNEWVQVVDGKMDVIELKEDLSERKGKPLTLFCASAADWSTGSSTEPVSYVTDGCFLYKTKTGKLLMIWSSFYHNEYAIGIAESSTNKVSGPWRQQSKQLFTKNGGHAMIFKGLDGQLYLTLHQPNSPSGMERAHIFRLIDEGDTLSVSEELSE